MDKGAIAPKNQPCLEHEFLFVNESTAHTGFKAGRRHDVRSHIRKHVIRQYSKDRRYLQQETGHRGTRYPVLAPSEVAGEESERFEVDAVSGLRLEADPKQSKPGMVADSFSERWGEAPANHTSEEMVCDQTHNNINSKVSWQNVSVVKVVEESTEEGFKGHADLAYCLHCGTPQNTLKIKKRLEENKNWLVAKQTQQRNQAQLSPLQFLGAGRVDPFISHPAEAKNPFTYELMDHAVTYLLPGLVPDGENNAVNPVAKAWFTAGQTVPLLFHALVFAGSIHLDFMRLSTIYPNSPIALTHKLVVIEQLNMIMSNPIEAQKDEVILAILILASHEARDQTENKIKPFDSPLMSAQWLNVYGNIQYVPAHMKAVMELIAIRGGIEHLKLHGLAETIVCGDIIAATNTLSKPSLPPLQKLSSWIEYVVEWANSPTRFTLQVLGRGFFDLQQYGLTSDAIYIFQAMGSTTIAIDHYLKGIPAGLTLGQIAKVRTAVHQRLLLLPTSDELAEVPPHHRFIYDACRTTALIYSIAVIFPVPNTFTPFQTLVSRLQNSIGTEGFNKDIHVPDLLLWMLIIGGVAALDKPERVWYVSQLSIIVKKRNIYEWKCVEKILGSFLWLDSACSQGGRKLWLEVMERTRW